MKAQDLILRMLQLHPNLGATHVGKLLYLFDIACIQLEGKPCTGLPWEWAPYGPYCREIEKETLELKRQGKIEIGHVVTQSGREWEPRTPIDLTPQKLTSKEAKILQFIVDRFGSLSVDELLKFVYETPPMKAIQKRGSRGTRLNLASREDVPAYFFDPKIAHQILDSKSIPKSKLIPFDKAWKKLEAKVQA